ncbi:hypothetical protein TanjilG_21295 [Lupinus angustifolius]|uniref:Uncharacterized protein n=1 Tax=Lupinus angustifolius TaxID=3871 RepID=A0A4P1RN58_LUPAN|nr:PREDICTED: uncharacterized protein LOC109345136 [Lupinus angustifolius]OIW14155.1 hypothetical protein TanjilG_21295 [Lupinus angustifolius]
MLSKFFFNINSHTERKKPKETNTDELALVKAAAWAWYQHGSGSEAKAMVNEFHVRRTQRENGPSRYKLEAMAKKSKEEGASIHTKNKPLLDTYEIQSISRQLDKLIIESGHGNNKVGSGKNSVNDGLDNSGRNMKKKKRISKGFWQIHGVVCGRRDDVVEGTGLRGDRLSSKHVPVVNLVKCLKVNGAF